MMQTQWIRRLFVFSVSVLAAIVAIGLIRVTMPPLIQEILLDSDATFWPFTVQNIMWVALFIGFGELFLRWSAAADEVGQLARGYLPTDGTPLVDSVLARIKAGIRERRFGRLAFLPRMIERTIDQFRVSRSEEQAISVLNSSIELYMHEIDLRYSTLRYLTWLIPSLGFIGTVMGIMFALQYAGVPANAEADDFLYQVTQRLGVAFTTTLLALIMSAILVLLQSLVQNKEERALNGAGQYCLDNLILRLGAVPDSARGAQAGMQAGVQADVMHDMGGGMPGAEAADTPERSVAPEGRITRAPEPAPATAQPVVGLEPTPPRPGQRPLRPGEAGVVA